MFLRDLPQESKGQVISHCWRFFGNRTALSVANNQAAAKGQLQSNQLPIGGGAQIQGQAFIGTNNQVEINALEHPLP